MGPAGATVGPQVGDRSGEYLRAETIVTPIDPYTELPRWGGAGNLRETWRSGARQTVRSKKRAARGLGQPGGSVDGVVRDGVVRKD
jgi:hypothetical protein